MIKPLTITLSLPFLIGPAASAKEGPPRGHRPPPVIAALDANGDGVISAEEIANASAALATLDRNGDGKLTPQELRPPRPEGEDRGRPRGDRERDERPGPPPGGPGRPPRD